MNNKPDNTALDPTPREDVRLSPPAGYVSLEQHQTTIGAAVKRCAEVLDRHDSAPMKPSPYWPAKKQDGYINGQLDAAASWKREILATEPEAVKALEEIEARLKAEREKESIWVEALSEVIPDDCKDWRDAADEERPEIAASIIRNLRAREAALEVLLEKADMRTVRAALEKEGI